MIPLGVMQDAHYTMNVPKYLNLGSLGLTLAHEILHSLDETGRDFASSGALLLRPRSSSSSPAPPPRWDQRSSRGYSNATRCLREQYPAHFRRPLRIDKRSILVEVDGDFTLAENVCDVDGMGAAAGAFLDLLPAGWVDGGGGGVGGDGEGGLVHLPNNPYSPQQLFFINAAQVLCKRIFFWKAKIKCGINFTLVHLVAYLRINL